MKVNIRCSYHRSRWSEGITRLLQPRQPQVSLLEEYHRRFVGRGRDVDAQLSVHSGKASAGENSIAEIATIRCPAILISSDLADGTIATVRSLIEDMDLIIANAGLGCCELGIMGWSN